MRQFFYNTRQRMPRTPQFASTPRFLLSQRGPPPSSSLSARRPRPEAIDEDDSPQNTPLAKRVRGRPFVATPASRLTDTPRTATTRDVIQDSEDDESALSQADVDSDMEAEYEALFGEREGSTAKRRRVGDEDHDGDQQNGDHNGIDDEDDNDNKNGEADDQDYHQPPNDTGNETPQQEHTHSHTHAFSSDENIPSSPLKSPSKTQLPTPTPNANRPRFLLSASSQLHTPSQSHSHRYPPSSTKQTYTTPSQFMTPAAARIATDSEPGPAAPPSSIPPPSTRRKPGFVLPRSPSPDAAVDDVLSLFSPSRTQRRGKGSRASGQGYVSGGMAEQVRGWVLEMGVKGNHVSEHGPGQKYAFIVRVEEAERSVMGSCGELVFVRGVHVDEGLDGGDDGVVRNVLLMGAPQSRSLPALEEGEETEIPDLKTGDRVGVGRGLVWDVELESMQESRSGEMEKWQVCMEWDVL
ncbi:hypothetical protein P170DRAFT_512412 [Aspergillus steynii IBT 23096]|uniref:Uncharacterized protein n=1 Tax=Aspergillus steynii IBT 23096 TaxID=1392250 RepID=A0A2I2FYS2_9EURO|nr:uncharacterized protein P170DRAFT_512412 [Aspergillus steynii IBT 23096]PLB45782.1 hypothetical protein P170DRAFT_512412 [Aspergillus steynii IBT 23096]